MVQIALKNQLIIGALGIGPRQFGLEILNNARAVLKQSLAMQHKIFDISGSFFQFCL